MQKNSSDHVNVTIYITNDIQYKLQIKYLT